VVGLVATVLAHGFVSHPYARQPGPAMLARCGEAIYADVTRDNTSHVEGLPEMAARTPGFDAALCNLWLCKGLQFDDNSDHVQSYPAGTAVNLKVRLTIPHAGLANVSVVDAVANQIIGAPLKVWEGGYADMSEFYARTTPKDHVDFEVIIPDLGGKCAAPAECVGPFLSSRRGPWEVICVHEADGVRQVIQWWWFGTGAKQTYESCIDFIQPA
jgi:hypothetical protein